MSALRYPVALLVLAGCATPEPAPEPGAVRAWGSVREALRDGHTEARVEVSDVTSPNLVGVGAAAGLEGEITIVDGACYLARVRDGEVETVRSDDVAATMLFAADVAEWRDIAIEADVAADELAAFVAERASEVGLDTAEPFPFLLEGELVSLEAHVIAGECPTRARMQGTQLTSPPVHRSFARVRGRLVGIHASHGGGVMTHHGSVLHVHVLVEGEAAFTGHCEAAGVAAGAVLRIPAQ